MPRLSFRKTEWPWYSYIAPMSWLVEGDVSKARSHMNLSHWNEYTGEKQQEILARVGGRCSEQSDASGAVHRYPYKRETFEHGARANR
jgi:hypothetical protein